MCFITARAARRIQTGKGSIRRRGIPLHAKDDFPPISGEGARLCGNGNFRPSNQLAAQRVRLLPMTAEAHRLQVQTPPA